MEKSESLRVNDKPNLDLVEKENSTIPRNPGMSSIYGTVPIMQPPYYPATTNDTKWSSNNDECTREWNGP